MWLLKKEQNCRTIKRKRQHRSEKKAKELNPHLSSISTAEAKADTEEDFHSADSGSDSSDSKSQTKSQNTSKSSSSSSAVPLKQRQVFSAKLRTLLLEYLFHLVWYFPIVCFCFCKSEIYFHSIFDSALS